MATATRSSRQGVVLHRNISQVPVIRQKVTSRTENSLPSISSQHTTVEKKKNEERVSKVTKKKTQTASTAVVTPPSSAPGSKKRVTSASRGVQSRTKPVKSKTPSPAPSLVNVIKLQKGTSQLKLKDEEPRSPDPVTLEQNTIEIKSQGYFYLPKRRLVHKPSAPFKLFINESHSLAKLVWLYLLESQMPFEKIPITSKEGKNASKAVPMFCKHCIFTDGDTALGQPTAIIRYICTNYTRNLLMGTDASQISQSFSWIHWAVSVLHRDLYYMTNGELRKGTLNIADVNKKDMLQTSLDSVSLYLDMLEKIFAHRKFLLGDVAWFCDSVVGLVMEDASSLSLKAWPNVQQWLDRVRSQPHWDTVSGMEASPQTS